MISNLHCFANQDRNQLIVTLDNFDYVRFDNKDAEQ